MTINTQLLRSWKPKQHQNVIKNPTKGLPYTTKTATVNIYPHRSGLSCFGKQTLIFVTNLALVLLWPTEIVFYRDGRINGHGQVTSARGKKNGEKVGGGLFSKAEIHDGALCTNGLTLH